MELKKMLTDSINEIDFETIIKEQVKTTLEKTIQSKIEDQFRSYSSIGKKIEAAITKSLSFDPNGAKLFDYRDFVLDQVNTSLASFVTTDAARYIKDHIDESVIGEKRDLIDFDNFMQELTDKINSNFEWDACSCDGPEPFQLEVSQKDYSWSTKYYNLKIFRTKESSYSYLDKKDREEVLLMASLNEDRGVSFIHCHDDDFGYVESWFKALRFRKTKLTGIKDWEHSFGPEC